MRVLEAITLAETVVGAVACAGFCGWYWWKQKRGWPKTEHGWFMMVLGINLGTLFSLIFTSRLFGPWPGREVAILVLYTGLIGITLWMPRLVYLSYRHQPEDKTRK